MARRSTGTSSRPTGSAICAFAWSPDHAIVIVGRPIADAVTAHRLSTTVGVGEWRDLRTVAIGADLAVEEGTMRVDRLGPEAWRLTGVGRRPALDGRSRAASRSIRTRGSEWPLELD